MEPRHILPARWIYIQRITAYTARQVDIYTAYCHQELNYLTLLAAHCLLLMAGAQHFKSSTSEALMLIDTKRCCYRADSVIKSAMVLGSTCCVTCSLTMLPSLHLPHHLFSDDASIPAPAASLPTPMLPPTQCLCQRNASPSAAALSCHYTPLRNYCTATTGHCRCCCGTLISHCIPLTSTPQHRAPH